MKQIDKVSGDVIKEYRKIAGCSPTKFISVFTNNGSETCEEIINGLIDVFKKKENLKKCVPIKYQQLTYPKLIPYNIDPYINKEGRHRFVIREKTGLFKLSFNDGSFLLVARWIEGFGKNWSIRSVVIGERYTYYAYLRAFDHEVKKKSKPKNGIYRGQFNQHLGTVDYLELKSLPKSPVIHPQVAVIEKDMKFYFDNVKIYTRYRQSGVRKFMLVSEPGTGKTSLFYKIALDYKESKCVMFCTDIQTAASHIALCAKHKVSTIIFLEDADSCLQGNANSSVLNFLDGVDTPHNPSGTMVLMSTNFPDNIEPRILARPGRIDRVYKFEFLTGKYAFECAKLYFGKFFNINKLEKEITSIVNNMTGAQIKELALSSMSFAASERKKIDVGLIKKVKKKFQKNLKEAYKYAEQNSFKKITDDDAKFGFHQ